MLQYVREVEDRTVHCVKFALRQRLLLTALVLVSGVSAFGQTETVLYAFKGQSANDGYFPEFTPLVLDKAGNLYGTTVYGGGGPCPGTYPGCGMIYQLVSPAQSGGAWTENVIWRFQGGVDGGYPGDLLAADGRLWGTVGTGGTGACTSGCGYLFRLTPPTTPGGAWTKTDVFDFVSASAACAITASDPLGNFYGVGGSSGNPNGNICTLTRPSAPGGSWTSTDLYDFKGVPPHKSIGDGSSPLGVTFAGGNLAGTTIYGGYCQRFEGGSCFGTIFVLTPPSAPGGSWTESVVYRFSNLDQNPNSGVVVDKIGAVYGTTAVYAYKFVGGTFTVIASFSDVPPNGYAPTGGVILDSSGNAYGVTAAGGQFGDGTVYKLTAPTYSQIILHSFAGGADGWNPEGPLTISSNGVLFGTTQIGGNNGCNFGNGGTGCGTIFEVIP